MSAAPLSDEICKQTLALYEQFGSQTDAAAAVGLSRTTFQSRLFEARRRFGVSETGESRQYKRHVVIPDLQVKPGVPLDHLPRIGKFIMEHQPDSVICLGDFADVPSLSTWDKGRKVFEGRRYKADVQSVHTALELLMAPLVDEGFAGRLVLALGNHENRVTRAADMDAVLDGTISVDDFGFEAWGWEVIPFLEPVEIDGITYCHYFYNPNTGRPYGGTCMTKLKNIGLSFVMGHQQGIDIAMRELPNGRKQHGLVAGSCYQHDELYRGPQANSHYQGIIMLDDVCDGSYNLTLANLDALKRRYN